jgi:flagellum-specific peptidoglycan hydrolase FlgJ
METEDSPIMRQMADAFERLRKRDGFPPRVGLAMSACESGWWKSVTGDFNYWGKTRNPEAGAAKFCPTTEYVTHASLATFRPDERATAVPHDVPNDGAKHKVSMSRWFASYASLDESINDFVALLENPHFRYFPAWQKFKADGDEDAFLTAVCDAGYATGDAKRVEMTILHQQNIRHAADVAQRKAA